MTTAVPAYAVQALFHGAYTGNLKSVDDAIHEYGAPINLQRAGDGATALIMAAANYRNSVIEYLIHNGADVNIQTRDSGSTALIVAAHNNNVKGVQLLMGAGADINAASKNGQTVIMHTVRWMHEESGRIMFKMLLKAGANVLIKDKANKTLLDYVQELSDKTPKKAKIIQMIREAEDLQTGDPTALEGGRRKTRRRRTRRRRN